MSGASRIGLTQVCLAGVLWGTGGLVVTVLHDRSGMSATTASAWRMLIAAAALVVFTAARGRVRDTVAAMRASPTAVIVVGCGTALYQVLYFASVLAVGVSIATVVSLGLAPILAATWEHLHDRTKPSAREVGVLLSALAGLLLISGSAGQSPSDTADRPLLGLLLAVAAGATYAATTVLGHTLARRIEPIALTTCATTAGALFLVPFLAFGVAGGHAVVTDAADVGLLVYLGVVTMAMSYVLLYAGLRTTRGSAATVATLVEPLSAAALAALLLGERPTVLAIAGGGLILIAVVALRSSRHPT